MLTSRLPDLEALRTLRAVMQHGSISSAAHALERSQQAVSARMRSLESTVGVPLLVRSPQGVTPTEAGVLLASWAEDVLDAADRLEAGIGSLTGGGAPLAIGASQTIAESLLPGWLVRLRRSEEEAGLAPTTAEPRVGNSTEVAHLVRTRTIELGFIETPRIPDDLGAARVGTDELVTVVAPGHPWASRADPIGLTELAAAPLVMREPGSGTRDALADILAAQTPPLTPHTQAEFGTAAAVRSAIAAGLAPGVISRLGVRDDLVLGRLRTVVVDAPPFARPLTAVFSRRGTLSAAAERLLRIAQNGTEAAG